MRTQASPATPGQLNYVKHWSHPDNGGHEFPRGAVIPEDISIKPASWALPSRYRRAPFWPLLRCCWWQSE